MRIIKSQYLLYIVTIQKLYLKIINYILYNNIRNGKVNISSR